MALLVTMFVAGSIGMGAGLSERGGSLEHISEHAGHETMARDADCPMAAQSVQADRNAHKGHGACAMTVCCFSAGPELLALLPEFQLLPASYARMIERRLPQAEPERAKKPPKQA
ncbi:MAG: hypothetical protein RIG84_04230 [Roseovarius sp.]